MREFVLASGRRNRRGRALLAMPGTTPKIRVTIWANTSAMRCYSRSFWPAYRKPNRPLLGSTLHGAKHANAVSNRCDSGTSSRQRRSVVLLHLSGKNRRQISRKLLPKLKGTPYCPFFNFRISSMPASTARAFRNDLKPSMAETRNFDAAMILLHDIVQVLAGAYLYGLRTPEVEFVPHAHTSQCGMAGSRPSRVMYAVGHDASGPARRCEPPANRGSGSDTRRPSYPARPQRGTGLSPLYRFRRLAMSDRQRARTHPIGGQSLRYTG